MAATFGVSLTGEPQRAFRLARERGQDLRPAWRAIGQQAVTFTKNRFTTSRAPDGSSWQPSRKTSGLTLVLKGLLLRSISARPATNDGVDVGSNRVYAGIHQSGGVIRAKTAKGLRFRVGPNGAWVSKREVDIPKREYLGVNDQEMDAYGRILLRHVGGPLTGEAPHG